MKERREREGKREGEREGGKEEWIREIKRNKIEVTKKEKKEGKIV